MNNFNTVILGKGCPKPIKTWAQCGVSTKELNILKKLGFDKPTPIQAQAIPAIMSGRDLIGENLVIVIHIHVYLMPNLNCYVEDLLIFNVSLDFLI